MFKLFVFDCVRVIVSVIAALSGVHLPYVVGSFV